jgi:hypothetical protein
MILEGRGRDRKRKRKLSGKLPLDSKNGILLPKLF